MDYKIFQTVCLAVAASIVLYCGTAYNTTIKDASAQDAGANDATVERVCDCPATGLPCIACSGKTVFKGFFEASHQELTVGTLFGFDPDSAGGLPTLQRWYHNAVDGTWNLAAFPVLITNEGIVIVRSNSTEYVNREFQVIFTWVKPNPDPGGS